MDKEIAKSRTNERLLATGGVIGALAASTCCVLPLAFVSAGISGAWIGTLTRMAPYQPIFLAIAAGCVATGFWLVYARKRVTCAEPACGAEASRRFTKIALWAAVVILVVAASAQWWAKLFI